MDFYLEVWRATLNWQPSPREIAKFQELYDRVLAGNRVHNLTRITEPVDFWEKHLWDSLRGIKPLWQRTHLQAIDVGTGAGFPGLPCGIVHPTWQLTLLDSTLKKVKFVKEVITALDLPNATPIHARAEELAREKYYRHRFDVVLLRAVGSVAECLEYALPLVRSGGTIVLYRGQWLPGEEEQLRGLEWQIDRFVTPLSHAQRTCIYVRGGGSSPPVARHSQSPA